MTDVAKEATFGIVGLGGGPYGVDDGLRQWPTGGCHDTLMIRADDYEYAQPLLKRSGRSKEDWLELADLMLQRWLDFKIAVEKL